MSKKFKLRGQGTSSSRGIISSFFLGAAVLALAFSLSACMSDEGSGGSGGSDSKSVDISLAASFPGSSDPNAIGAPVTAVASVGVKVVYTSGGAVVIAETEMTEDPPESDNWTLALTGLPTGAILDFFATAYDAGALGGTAIYSDSIIGQTMNSSGNVIAFVMESIELGHTIPKIEGGIVPVAVSINTIDTPFTFTFSSTADTSVDYDITVDVGSIDATNDGIATPGTNLSSIHAVAGDLVIYYSAPGSGSIGHNVTVWINDTAYPTVKAGRLYDFDVVIGDGTPSTEFGPSINGFTILRTGNDLNITANATAGNAVIDFYGWSGSGNFSGVGTGVTINSLVVPYLITDTGDITVTVTDVNGLTATLTQTILADGYP